MMKQVCVLFVLVAWVQAGIVREPTEKYNHTLTLDKAGDYVVHWKYNSTHVTFEVHVKTRGYVGFGISPNGNMYPSDVVVGWVKDGKTYFKDYHTVAKAPPLVDKSQDWFLLFSEENDQGTVLKFTRKKQTCDNDDLDINNATQRLIYSYHTDDPVDEHSIMYHGARRRGTKSVSLLNQQIPRGPQYGDDMKIIDIRPNNVIIPSVNTTYLCLGFQMPNLGKKHHMIQFEPIITPGNEELLHHLTIQRCPGDHPALHEKTTECFYDWPKGWPQCPEIVVAWATGGGAFSFPEEGGFSIGGPNDYGFYVMQVHYNNPSLKTGVIDSSGIRMHLTSSLRQHDVGSMIIGYQVGDSMVIPPKMPNYISSGICDPDILAKKMDSVGVSEFKVIATMQHAHLLGYGIKTRHFRGGKELKPIMDDPYYDFYFQEFRDLLEPRTVKRGDTLRVDCHYNSMGRDHVTFGGLSTGEEMCESFLYVYPNIDVEICSSYYGWTSIYPKYDYMYGRHDDFRKFISDSYDWHNETVRNDMMTKMRALPSSHLIYGKNGTNGMFYEFKGYTDVDNFTPYVPDDACSDTSTSTVKPGQVFVG